MNDWRQIHRSVIFSFLTHANAITDAFVLKGGTALMMCYDLDRFSEDIDFDGKANPSQSIITIVEGFSQEMGYNYRIAKDTDTVKRCVIHYDTSNVLRIEVSYRRKEIPGDETINIKGIHVYRIEPLCIMKTNAYSGRDKIRDLYDLTFIFNNFSDQLSPQTVSLVRSAIEHKGIEHFDYLVKDQEDNLIDKSKLAGDFLQMYDRLNLLYSDEEKCMLS